MRRALAPKQLVKPDMGTASLRQIVEFASAHDKVKAAEERRRLVSTLILLCTIQCQDCRAVFAEMDLSDISLHSVDALGEGGSGRGVGKEGEGGMEAREGEIKRHFHGWAD